jgi:hypothetical protein
MDVPPEKQEIRSPPISRVFPDPPTQQNCLSPNPKKKISHVGHKIQPSPSDFICRAYTQKEFLRLRSFEILPMLQIPKRQKPSRSSSSPSGEAKQPKTKALPALSAFFLAATLSTLSSYCI